MPLGTGTGNPRCCEPSAPAAVPLALLCRAVAKEDGVNIAAGPPHRAGVEGTGQDGTAQVADAAKASDSKHSEEFDDGEGGMDGVDGAGPWGFAVSRHSNVGAGHCWQSPKSRMGYLFAAALIREGGKGNRDVGGESRKWWSVYMVTWEAPARNKGRGG